MSKKEVTTFQAPNGETINVCPNCEYKFVDNWMKNSRGEEYCYVSHGLHFDYCNICQKESDF